MAVDRRRLFLLGGLAAAVVVAIWSWSGPAAPAAAPPAADRRATPRAQAEASGEIADVRLEALSAERAAPEEHGRNPFRFGARAPVAGATPAAAPAPDMSAAPPGPAMPSGPPPPPPITLKFIGIVEKGTTKVAILTGAGYTLHGREGDAIDGRYRILRIGVESIEIAYLDGRGRQTIRLSGQ